jgi:hypothetical protein
LLESQGNTWFSTTLQFHHYKHKVWQQRKKYLYKLSHKISLI